MILLTDELRAQLLANGRQRDIDHVPVVKFFNPLGAGVWLATELDADGDILFSGDFPISVWAEAAREAGSIRRAERMIYAAARKRREGV